jgi:DNA-binding response OmpR family regulator
MSVLATHPAPTRRARIGRPRISRPRAVPGAVTVTISVDAPDSPEGARVLAALRDLVAAAGSVSVLPSPSSAPPTPGVRLDPRSRIATREGVRLDLSRLEFDLLLFFARNPQQVFTRSQLLQHVWGHKHTTHRTVDVHVSRLRTKAGDPDVIATVYGVGYRLAEDAGVEITES